MEDISDDEVKAFASNWVKRIQNSILSPVDDVNDYGVVRTRFGSNDERMQQNHEFVEEANGKTENFNLHQPSTALFPECSDSLSFSQLSTDFGGRGDVLEENVTPFERASKQSNVSHTESTAKQDEVLTRQASSKSTPRVDVALLRERRLAFFDSKLKSPGLEDSSHDKNRNILTDISARHSHSIEAQSSSGVEKFDSLASKSNSFTTQKPSDNMYRLQSPESPLSSHYFNGGSPRSGHLKQHFTSKSPRVHDVEHDEEDIKLELWGLKEAVQSGEVDLNEYLKKPAWKNSSVYNSERQSTDLQTLEKLPRNAFGPLRDKTKPIMIPDSGGYSNSLFHSFGNHGQKNWNGTDDVNNVHFSKQFHKTSCAPVIQSEVASNCFNGPEPQINGPLYSGFETSDSESSLLSFGSKCDDVHYRKVVKKQDSPVLDKRMSPRVNGHSTNKKQENKNKPKRGKDKILMEFTEFMEGSVSPKDRKHSKQNTGNSSNDQHLKCLHDSSKVDNADSLLSTGPKGHLQNGFAEKADEVNLNESPTCKTSIQDNGAVQSHDHYNLTNETMVPVENQMSNVKGKICPKCSEVNSRAANWCIECGTALVCVEASCLTSQQQKSFQKQCLDTQALIKETLKTPTNLSQLLSYDKASQQERSLSEEITNLSLQVSHSTSNLEETKYSSSPVGYKRRWLRSSIAWSSYNSSELSKSPSFVNENSKMKEKKRATSFTDLMSCSSNEKAGKHKRNSRNKSARQRTVSCSSFGPDDETNSFERLTNSKEYRNLQASSVKSNQKEKESGMCVQRPRSSVWNQREKTNKGQCSTDYPRNGLVLESQSCPALLKSSSVSSLDGGTRRSMSQAAKTTVPPLNLQDVDSYDRILTLIRSQRDSDPVPYLYLPDEILLLIFSFLPHKDLVSCSRVCWQFYRISMDESLWKVIVLKQNNNITDEWLQAIGMRRPMSLTISQCHSDKVTAKGLRDLFRNCSDSLEELNFNRCRGSELIGESVLLHVAARCHHLRSADASWSNVSDNGVQALVDNVKRLECLCLNGCQAVTDQSVKSVANKHGKTLRIFEVFGCFNITPAGLRILGQTCKQLQTLNIGQCYKITDAAIGCLVSNLPELENLDLRGCKQVRDSAVKKIVRHCPLITSLTLANCPLITDVSLAEIATNLPRIRSLDLCGCSKVTDRGICALSKNCHRLELLDLTSTGVGHKSVLSLANYCSQSLCNLKLSFLTDIYDNTVVHLAKQCKRLTTLHLYGCKRIRNTSNLKFLNPALTIEC